MGDEAEERSVNTEGRETEEHRVACLPNSDNSRKTSHETTAIDHSTSIVSSHCKRGVSAHILHLAIYFKPDYF